MSGNVRMDRRLYLTADGSRVVPDGDPEAAILLCQAGGEVPHATAARYGLLQPANPEPTAEPEAEPNAETKQAQQPANKARGRTADK